MERHQAKVDKLCTIVQHFHRTQSPFRVYHGSTNSTRHANFDAREIVDVSHLNDILFIDRIAKTAVVEPNVPMDMLVRETTRVGLVPPVVMEFPGITVGGGFVGTAGESSSFKYGFFDRTILSAEVVLASGELVNASKRTNPDLFEGLRGSFGSLGVLTLVEIQLVEARPYVEVTYQSTSSIGDTVRALQAQVEQADVDYVDGILFSKTSGVVVTGRLTDDLPTPKRPRHTFARAWDEWFWIHAKSVIAKGRSTSELVPLQDYLFRYDRGAFWVGMYAFRQFMIPFIWLIRFLGDYFMHTRIMYHALHASGHTDRYIIQDIAVPAPNAKQYIEWLDASLGIYPLWLCPLREDARSSMGYPRRWNGPRVSSSDIQEPYQGKYINVGVWGPGPLSAAEYVHINRSIEQKTREVGGLKWLYARVFYTEDEWRELYDHESYDALREQYRATSLPSIWDKVKDRGTRQDRELGLRGWIRSLLRCSNVSSGLYGVYKALSGGDYLLKKEKAD